LELRLSELKVQPFLLISQKGLVKYQSPGFGQIFFAVKSGDPLEQYIHPEDRKDFQAWLRSLNSKRADGVAIKHLRLADQSGRVVAAMVRPEPLKEDHIFWCWENKGLRAEGDYWETALTPAMEEVFSSILDGAFLVNIEGKVIAINQALSQMLGYHKLELIGLPVGRLFSDDPAEIQRSTRRFGLIMKYDHIQEANLTLRTRAGEKVEASLNGAVIRGEGNQLVGILAIVRDMRESKLMRQLKEKSLKLEQAMEELKEKDKVKDDFLSLVGHELRTPLSNILGYAEYLAQGNLEEKEKDEFNQVIYQEARRLARLVNEILDMSRLESGRLIYQYVLTALDPVLKEAVDSLQVEAEQRKMTIHLSLGFGREIWFDRDRILQVMINLLANAVKYSEPGREIRVESKEVDQGAMVSVRDQGLGIAREDLKKVFEKFHRAENIEHHAQGAGLGLPIARRIIDEGHGGRIWLESEGLGRGSVFYFWIPGTMRDG
jgi:PAS domain S-box-containing protein